MMKSAQKLLRFKDAGYGEWRDGNVVCRTWKFIIELAISMKLGQVRRLNEALGKPEEVKIIDSEYVIKVKLA